MNKVINLKPSNIIKYESEGGSLTIETEDQFVVVSVATTKVVNWLQKGFNPLLDSILLCVEVEDGVISIATDSCKERFDLVGENLPSNSDSITTAFVEDKEQAPEPEPEPDMTPREIVQALLESHKLWINTDGKKGEELDMQGLELKYLDFTGAKIEDCDLTESAWEDCEFKDSKYYRCDFGLSVYQNCGFDESVFNHCRFFEVVIKNSNCREMLIKESNLSLVDVEDCDLYHANINIKGE